MGATVVTRKRLERKFFLFFFFDRCGKKILDLKVEKIAFKSIRTLLLGGSVDSVVLSVKFS